MMFITRDIDDVLQGLEMANGMMKKALSSKMHKMIIGHSLIVTKVLKIQTKCRGPGPGFEPGS